MNELRTCPLGHEWPATETLPGGIDGCPICRVQGGGALPPPPEVLPILLPRVPGYEVLGELGRGGMGVVYKARHLKLNRVVALKMVQPLLGAAGPEWEQLIARFNTEARAVAALRHPNIVEIYDIGEHAGKPYFSLELCEGGGLDRKLAAAPLAPVEAAQLVETLARAIHAAHQANIVHRDLKPANVLLAEDGAPRVTDFGLAKKLDDKGQTQTGAVLGTPSYMAPEQARGRVREVGPAADIYALGAILYECLTGRPPFRGPTYHETLLQVIDDDPVSVRTLQPRTPRDLEIICLKCLHKDPARRYGTARELADDLGRFHGGQPIRARPVGTMERSWRWCQRRPAISSLLVLLAAALAGGAAGVGWQWSEAVREEKAKARALDDLQVSTRRQEATLYASQVALAHRECLSNNVPAARRLLDACPEERRGWEWRYVDRLCRDARHVLAGNEKGVRGVAFSPDGRRVASAGADGVVRVWDCQSGRLLHSLRAHAGEVAAVVFLADGRLASGGDDGTVRLWGADGAAARVLGRIGGKVHRLAVSADGRRLAAGGKSGERGVVLWWALPEGRQAGSLKFAAPVEALAFAPSGRELGVAVDKEVTVHEADGGKRLLRYGANTWARDLAFDASGDRIVVAQSDLAVIVDRKDGGLERLRGHDSAVTAVAWPRVAGESWDSAKVERVVSAGWDGTVRVWPVEGGEPAVLRGHRGQVACLAVSPDGRWVASGGGGKDPTVRLWPLVGGGEYRLARQSPESPLVQTGGVAFSPDGARLAVASWHIAKVGPGEGRSEGQVLLWDLTAGADALSVGLAGHDVALTAVAFGPAPGHLLATAGKDGEVIIREGIGGLYLRTIKAHAGAAAALAFHPDGTLFSGGEDGKVKVWDAATGRELYAVDGHEGGVQALALAPDGSWLASAGKKGGLRVCGLADRRVRWSREEPGRPTTCLAVSPDGRWLASGGEDEVVRVWAADTGGEAHTFRGHSGTIRGLAFHPREARLASSGGEGLQPGEVKVWDLGTGLELLTLRNRRGAITGVAFSPDGETLATADAGDQREGEARLWSASAAVAPAEPAGLRLSLERTWQAGKEIIHGLAFSPNGRWVAAAGVEGVVWLWDAKTGDVVGRWDDHEKAIMALAFSPDSKTLATGGFDRMVKLRDLPSGEVRATWPQEHDVLALAFDARGERLAVGLNADRLALWDVKTATARTRLLSGKVVFSVAFRGDGLLEGCCLTGVVQGWGPGEERPRFTLNAYDDYLYRSAFLGDGRVLLTAGDLVSGKKRTGVVRLWDTGNGKERAVLRGPTVDGQGALRCLAVTGDGALVAAGGADGKVYIWGPQTRRGLARLDAHAGGVRAVALAPDGARLATAGTDGVVKVWARRVAPAKVK